jgi:hypothetical protein
MQIQLGDFLPRVDWSWPVEPPARCLKMGAHTVELQGGLAVASVGAKHNDGKAVFDGLERAKQAAEHLKKGLPGSKEVTGKIENRVRMLRKLVEPYRYDMVIPKTTSKVIEDQIHSLGMYELELESAAIKDCGGRLTGAFRGEKEKLKPLPQIPPEVKERSQKQGKENTKATLRRMERIHARYERESKKDKKSRK